MSSFPSYLIECSSINSLIIDMKTTGKKTRFFSFLCLALLFHHHYTTSLKVDASFTGTYGINYGRIADNLIPPETVVVLLRSAKIRNVRIYDANHDVLRAFNNSGININVCVPNELLKDMSANQDQALTWVKQNVEPFLPSTRITGIAIGNEIFNIQDQEIWEALVGASKNIYTALQNLHLSKVIEVNSPHSEGVFSSTFPPSSGEFKPEILPYMKQLLTFFDQINSPFYVNAYPFLAYVSDSQHIDIRYALFKSNPGAYDPKWKLHYDNMFDAQIDASYAALERIGFDKMEVIVAETGWASKGDANEIGANIKNAKTYNKNLRKKLKKKKGTPHRPKTVVRAYIFALFNENLKPGPTSERNFGLFKPDGSVSYDIGFKGLSSATSLRSFKVVGYQVIICALYMLLVAT